jgi:hypothetical protein
LQKNQTIFEMTRPSLGHGFHRMLYSKNFASLQYTKETAMFQPLLEHLRKSAANGFRLTFIRVAVALSLALLLPALASAYTVVMRGGRRIEIPDTFFVTRTTLTYEYAPGLNVTLQISNIDIAATERANNEPGGSLLKRAEQPPPPQVVQPQSATGSGPTRARRTVTDSDLEASRRTRLQSEAAYERRRLELGLPSLAESRRRAEEEAARLSEQSRQSEAEEAQQEAYWRARATELRTAITVTDAEINYLSARLADSPDPLSTVAFTSISNFGVLPFPARAIGVPQRTVLVGSGGGFVGASNMGAQLVGRIAFGGGSSRGRLLVNAGETTSRFRRRAIFTPGVLAAPVAIFNGQYPYYPTYERAALVARLQELEATRAGLLARWRLLEDEARRAGAPPGWLRP